MRDNDIHYFLEMKGNPNSNIPNTFLHQCLEAPIVPRKIFKLFLEHKANPTIKYGGLDIIDKAFKSEFQNILVPILIDYIPIDRNLGEIIYQPINYAMYK